MPITNLPQDLQQAIEELNNNYIQSNPAYFDAFADNALILVIESSRPIIGGKEYRRNFEATLTSGHREMTVLDAEGQLINNENAVVTQSLEIQSPGNPVSVIVRESLTLTKINGVWKIISFHAARLDTSLSVRIDSTTATPRLLDRVRVINERIATAASAVGIAQ